MTHTPPGTSTGKWMSSSRLDAATAPRLLLRFRSFVRYHKRFEVSELLFEPVLEVMHSVLEEHDKAKNKENKKDDPKESAYQRHGEQVNVGQLPGQRFTLCKLRIEPPDEAAMLFAPCASRCWT
jgi:hypothetical protein